MMGNALKGQGASLTLQIKGGGPLGTVLAVFFVPTFYVLVRKFFPISAVEQERAAAHAKEVGITASPVSPAGH